MPNARSSTSVETKHIGSISGYELPQIFRSEKELIYSLSNTFFEEKIELQF